MGVSELMMTIVVVMMGVIVEMSMVIMKQLIKVV